MKHQFTLEYWQDDGWFVGRLKEVPAVFSQGDSLEQLELNIEDAYQLIAESTARPPQRALLKPLMLEVA